MWKVELDLKPFFFFEDLLQSRDTKISSHLTDGLGEVSLDGSLDLQIMLVGVSDLQPLVLPQSSELELLNHFFTHGHFVVEVVDDADLVRKSNGLFQQLLLSGLLEGSFEFQFPVAINQSELLVSAENVELRDDEIFWMDSVNYDLVVELLLALFDYHLGHLDLLDLVRGISLGEYLGYCFVFLALVVPLGLSHQTQDFVHQDFLIGVELKAAFFKLRQRLLCIHVVQSETLAQEVIFLIFDFGLVQPQLHLSLCVGDLVYGGVCFESDVFV